MVSYINILHVMFCKYYLNIEQDLYKDWFVLVHLQHVICDRLDLYTHPMFLGIVLLTKDRSREFIPCKSDLEFAEHEVLSVIQKKQF